MRLGPRLEQQQKLILTPELKQAIFVLQLPVAELEDFVAAEALDNPLLDLRADVEAVSPVDEAPEPEWLEYFHDASDLGYARQAAEPRLEPDFAAPAPTLTDHLLFQLAGLRVSAAVHRACTFLIDSLDANGYLTLAPAEAVAALQLPPADVDEGLALLRSFDPPGVGASTLSECLLSQLTARGLEDPLLTIIISGHLDDLAAGRLGRIAIATGTTPAAVEAAAAVIRSLDPKPGRAFSSGEEARYIRPDVAIEHVGNDYIVVVNDAVTPRLRISPYYRQLLRQGDAGAEAEGYIERKLRAAVWLVRSLEQRRLTLHRVVEVIARYQRPFLALGIRHLRSLTLREVADQLGIHESTVSRATAAKYVQTPQGCYPLRFFFASGVTGAVGESYSAPSVKQLIRDLIAAEDPAHPLSDDRLAELLGERGISIARRTVAKYRDEDGIAPSSRRRR